MIAIASCEYARTGAGGALTAWWARERERSFGARVHPGYLGVVLFGSGIVGATGAITALGDTLFPVSRGGGSGFVCEYCAGHLAGPALFGATSCAASYLCGSWWVSLFWSGDLRLKDELSRVLWDIWPTHWSGAVALQLMLGVLNVLLHAPGWMQIVHLLVADWCGWSRY